MGTLLKSFSGFNIVNKFLKPRIDVVTVPNRGKRRPNGPPKKRYSPWLLKQHRVLVNDNITRENTKFIQDVIETKYGKPDPQSGAYSPLKIAPIEPVNEWTENSRRTGLIVRKLGIYPMWMKNGKKVLTTLLQVCDNHVIKYIPPEEWEPIVHKSKLGVGQRKKLGCMLVGAESVDPQLFTKQYCGLFTDAGVMPKRLLARFLVSPDAAMQPGTPLTAAHYRPGDYIDVRGKTMDRGFQGVMKRWGFHGMPATHGVTKTHRRPGNIGSGGTKARVMPGTKMPGHMGNRYRIFPCVQILKINTKYNVIWVRGQALPGETNTLLQIYDSLLPHKKYRADNPPHFPTYIPKEDEPLPEEMMIDELHRFDAPTIEFKVEDKK